jgi:serine/threonine protein kinase
MPLDAEDELPPPPSQWARPSLLGIEIPGHEVLEELGRGGMGVVYKARQNSLNRLVAVKMIQPGLHVPGEELQRFRIEAEAVARLQHPNIVHIYEVGEQSGCRYLLLEYIGGGSLADKVGNQPQPPDQAAELVETLARAVHAAHQRGIIHRDLKPANVLLTEDGIPKVADFGLAKMLPALTPAGQEKETASDARGPTRSGVIMGTPSYMAPEQARGKIQAIGPPTDVYALGAILYHLLTGRPPFRADSPLDTLHQVISQAPRRPSSLQPDVPRDLEAICLRCLEKEPAQRYASAAALADDLQRFRQGQRPLDNAKKRRSSWPWAVGIGAAAILLIGVLSLWYISSNMDGNHRGATPSATRATAAVLGTTPAGKLASPPPVAGNPSWTIMTSLQETAPEETFDQIAFPSRKVGFVAGRAGVYKTDDAGATWKRIWSTNWPRVYALRFMDEQHGWLAADRLYETTDGGQNWRPVDLPVPVRAVTAFAVSAGRDLAAAGVTMDGALQICQATSTGKWLALSGEGDRGYWGGAIQPYRTWTASALTFLGPQEVLVVLYSQEQSAGVVLKTKDGGRSWDKVFERPEYLLHLHFASAQRGWLTGFNGKFWQTEDGGTTWLEQHNPEMDRTAGCLAFAPGGSSFGIAPLFQGKLLLTRDGTKWEAHFVDLQGLMPSAAVVDPEWIYVLAVDGRIAHYAKK